MNRYTDFFDRAKVYLREKLGITGAVLELSSIRVSAVLSHDAGGNYSISLRHSDVRNKTVDTGVAETDLFFAFEGDIFLSKEKNGQAGAAIQVPYVDGTIFYDRPLTGSTEFEALMTIFNGSIAIEDADGTKVMTRRPTLDFLRVPQMQYVAFSMGDEDKNIAPSMERLPQFSNNESVPLEPMVVISGKKETSLKLMQGAGDKSNIAGATGTQNVFTFYMRGIKALNMAARLDQTMAASAV
jgi:hypothetical protein